MYGRGYVIEHCAAALRERQSEKLYRAYVTDALMAIANNTANYVIPGSGVVEYGAKMEKRWLEIIQEKPEASTEKTEDNRPSVEIAADIWTRIRGEKP